MRPGSVPEPTYRTSTARLRLGRRAVWGDLGSDDVDGGLGNDHVCGGGGVADFGDDRLWGRRGSDQMFGGAGEDVLDAGPAGVTSQVNYLHGQEGHGTLRWESDAYEARADAFEFGLQRVLDGIEAYLGR